MVLGGIDYPQNKVDDNGQQEHNSQYCRAEPVVEAGLAAQPDRLGSPVVRHQRVEQGEDGDAGEEEGRDEGGSVTEVEHTQGESSEDDGEVEP